MRWAHGLSSDERRRFDFARFRSFTSSTAALRRRSPFPSKGKEQKGKEREFVYSPQWEGGAKRRMRWAHGQLSDEMRKLDFARFRSFPYEGKVARSAG